MVAYVDRGGVFLDSRADRESERERGRLEPEAGTENRPLLLSPAAPWIPRSEETHTFLDHVDDFIFGSNLGLFFLHHRRAIIRRPSRAFHSLICFYFALGDYSFLNLLLPVVPCAIAVGASQVHDQRAIFYLNYLALLALPGAFRYGSEVLSAKVERYGKGPMLLWNALFGVFSLDLEAVVIALCSGFLGLVQAYIIGKIVASCLLTLGLCFCTSGIRRSESYFNPTIASMLISLLFTAAIPLGVLRIAPSSDEKLAVISSRAIALVLLPLYGLSLFFRFKSHALLFDEEAQADEEETQMRPELRSLGILSSISLLISTPILTYFCSVYLFAALRSSPRPLPSQSFVGFCLIPLLAEAAELPKIIWLAYTDQMAFVLNLAAGTGVQVALFTAPMLCLLGWILGQPLTLRFGLLNTVALFTSIWIFGLQVWAGKSNYLSGAQSIAMYIVLSLAVYLS